MKLTPENFCYWLQGFTEIGGQPPTDAQWVKINAELQNVFNKVTPSYVAPSGYCRSIDLKSFNEPIC